jgi:hypothetical protein
VHRQCGQHRPVPRTQCSGPTLDLEWAEEPDTHQGSVARGLDAVNGADTRLIPTARLR